MSKVALNVLSQEDYMQYTIQRSLQKFGYFVLQYSVMNDPLYCWKGKVGIGRDDLEGSRKRVVNTQIEIETYREAHRLPARFTTVSSHNPACRTQC